MNHHDEENEKSETKCFWNYFILKVLSDTGYIFRVGLNIAVWNISNRWSSWIFLSVFSFTVRLWYDRGIIFWLKLRLSSYFSRGVFIFFSMTHHRGDENEKSDRKHFLNTNVSTLQEFYVIAGTQEYFEWVCTSLCGFYQIVDDQIILDDPFNVPK